ncbi:hypothetical protein CRENBAI_011095 [Crenichthys baileyi]|uniref:Uncharacterized protein n=1 Tax=Crenichthys baileyi TaxID=28760 RepID=A0AAV9RUA7_9TELE
MDLFSDLRERHLFNGSRQHMSLVRYCFLGVLQKELDDYKQLWNTHTIRPVRQFKCPSALSLFNTLMPTAGTPSDDDDEQENRFEELQRQSGLPPPLQWEAEEKFTSL